MSKQIAATLEIQPNGNVRLAPADALAEEQMRDLPRGARLNATVTVSRNTPEDEHMGLLRLYHAGINVLYENMESGPGTDYPTPTHVRKHILRELGFYVAIPQRDGSVRKEVESMSLDKMPLEDLRLCMELSEQWVEENAGWNPWTKWKEDHPFPKPAVTR